MGAPATGPQRGKILQHLLRLALIVLAVGCVLFFLREAVRVFGQLSVSEVFARPIFLAASLALSTLWVGFMALFWDWSIRRVFACPQLSLRDTFAAFTRSYLARYVPGKIWVIAARIEPLRRKSVAVSSIVGASLFEQIFNAAGAATLAVTLLLSFLNSHAFCGSWQQLDAWWIAAIIGATALIAVAVALGAGRLRSWIQARFQFDGKIALSPRHIGLAFIGGLSMACVEGLAVLPLLPWDAAAELSFLSVVGVCAAYPAARVIGQLGSISPAGLVVREGAFVFLTATLIGADAAVLVAIWMRALAMIAEVLMFCAGLLVEQRVAAPVTDA